MSASYNHLSTEIVSHIFSFLNADDWKEMSQVDHFSNDIIGAKLQNLAQKIIAMAQKAPSSQLYTFIKQTFSNASLTAYGDCFVVLKKIALKAQSLCSAPLPLRIPSVKEVVIYNEQIEKEAAEALQAAWPKMWEAILRIDPNLANLPSAQETNMSVVKDWITKNGNVISQITFLDLSNLSLKTLPTEIYAFKGLTMLILTNNLLTKLPDDMDFFPLVFLSLCCNPMKELPDSIGNLSSLAALDVSHCQLSNLPKTLGNLQELTSLNASHNTLTTLPPSLGELVELRDLNVSHNALTALPQELNQISSLNLVNLKGNPLVDFSPIMHAIGSKFCIFKIYKLCLEQPLIDGNPNPAIVQGAELPSTPELKKALYLKVWDKHNKTTEFDHEWCKEHLFDDMKIFTEAFYEATVETYLPSEKHADILYNLYRLAGSPLTEDFMEWGLENAFDNPLRLMTAIYLACNSNRYNI